MAFEGGGSKIWVCIKIGRSPKDALEENDIDQQKSIGWGVSLLEYTPLHPFVGEDTVVC